MTYISASLLAADYARLGEDMQRAEQADMVIAQWNTLPDPSPRLKNTKIGLGRHPGEALDKVFPLFSAIDLLLPLDVFPGFGGQTIQPAMEERIASAGNMIDRHDPQITIAIDGGAKSENAAQLVRAGADILIMGTALFGSRNRAERVRTIRESFAGSQHR
jgi:ribulose-phosphate 3-epimerase